MNKMSSLQKDFVASHLRSQIDSLEYLLHIVEDSGDEEYTYVVDSLKKIEDSARKLRSFISSGEKGPRWIKTLYPVQDKK